MSEFTKQTGGRVNGESQALDPAFAHCYEPLLEGTDGPAEHYITLLCSIAAFFSCPLALSHLSSLYLIHDVLGQVYVLKSGPYTGLISSHLVPSFALCSMLYSYIFIVLLDP